MPKKKTKATDKNQPSLYGEVDELYALLSAHESADKEALEAAEKRVTNANEHATEMLNQLHNTRKAMKIVERRRDELRPKPVKTTKEKVEAVVEKVSKEAAGAKAHIEGQHGTRPKPEGKPPPPTTAAPKKEAKEKA